MSSSFWKNVGSVLSGTAIAQAIPILGSLVLARLFAPEAYGGYSVWLAAVLIAAVVATLRLEMALAVVPDGEEREDAFGLVLATIIAALGAVALPAFLALYLGLLPAAMGGPLLLAAWLLAAALSAASDSWQAMAAADGAYRLLIKLRIGQAAFILGAQLVASLLARSAEELVLGHLAGLALSVAWAAFLRRPAMPPIQGIFARLASFWRRNPRFPVYSLPADAANSLSAQLPLMIVSARFGNELAGILALTMRVLGAPIGLLGRAVLDVFRRHAAEAYRARRECRAEYLSTLKILAAGSAIFVAGTVLFAEPIFAIAFGERWRMAGTVAMWLAPLFAMRFVASPLSYVFYIVGRQNIDLMWQIALFATTLAVLTLLPGFRTTLLAYSYCYSALYIVYLALSYRGAKGSFA